MKRFSFFLLTLTTLAIIGCGGSRDLTVTTPLAVRAEAAQSGGAPIIAKAVPKQIMVVQPSSSKMEVNEVKVTGYKANYTITVNDAGVVTIINKITRETTNYGAIRTINFVDYSVCLDLTGIEAQVYRLYQAAFNRQPDLPGLGFWIKAAQNGATLKVMSASFQASPEFKVMYGDNPSNSKIITSLYNNVLKRAPEQAGFDWWVARLAEGVPREDVMVGFSESLENKNNLHDALVGGVAYVPFNPPVGTPIAPQKTSYLNAKNNGQGSITLPTSSSGVPVKFMTTTEGIQNGYALGDFFQDGKYSLVAFTQNYIPTADGVGHAYFYKKDDKGNWVDHTTDILKDQTGCITPRKVIVADFNGDGKPDVFVACSGIDRALKAGEHAGEHTRLLLSQADGSYKNVDMGFDCYCHGAAAAVMTTDGYADIVVADPVVAERPYVLVNNKNGTFTADYSRFPNAAAKTPIYTVEMIDFDNTGKFDVILAGGEQPLDYGTFVTTFWATTILHNPGNGNFANATATVLPSDPMYAGVLDIVYDSGFIYTNRTNFGKTSDTSYTAAVIQKVSYKTLLATEIYVHNTKYENGVRWVDWIVPVNGTLVALNGAFMVDVPAN